MLGNAIFLAVGVGVGGIGSGGSRNGGTRYLTVEQCYRLDLAELRRCGFLTRESAGRAVNSLSGPWTWTSSGGDRDGDQTTATVQFDWRPNPTRYGDAPRFTIYYGKAPTDAELQSLPVWASGYLITTAPPLGGVRYWWECPRCWHRCRVLYAYPAEGRVRFMCRKCQRLRYYSHNEKGYERHVRKARKYWRRAGSRDGQEPYHKPKWMRWRTFSRLVLAGRWHSERADRLALQRIGVFLASCERRRAA